MPLFRFAWRLLRREWRSGELQVLALAVTVAVASITAVGLFNERVHRALHYQASELLAADLLVASNQGIAPEWQAQARTLGLRTAETLEFASMVVAGDRLQLAEIKTVGPGYPLRGRLEIRPRLGGELEHAAAPAPGTAWVDEALARRLSLVPGARVRLGEAQFEVAAVLAFEPDRGGALFSIAPRLMINSADLPGTRLLQPGSQATRFLLLAGEAAGIDAYARWIKPRLAPGERALRAGEARPEVQITLERAEHFLGLASLVTALVAGLAIAVAARRYCDRRLDSVAVLRCLGAAPAFVVRAYGLQLAAIGLAAAITGALLGAAAQAAVAVLLADLVSADLPLPGPRPAFTGAGAGLVLLLGFALPLLLRLRDVPALRVLRRDLGPAPRGLYTLPLGALLATYLLLLWQAGEARLATLVLGGAVAGLGVLAALAWALLGVLQPLRRRVGVAWRFGLASVVRRRGASVLQIACFALGIALLLLLVLIRADLLRGWHEAIPPDAPNRFLINIQPDQVAAVRRLLATGGTSPALYPMVRGRLVEIAGRPVSAENFSEPRGRRLLQREFNLSWSGALHPGNRTVAGAWWSNQADPGQFSVEQGLAETLGIRLGDELVFRIAGSEVRGRVTHLRAVDWDSFQVNFFVVAPPGLLDEFPGSYITAFHLPAERQALLSELVTRFPNVTVIDVDAFMTRARTLIERVSRALEFVFGFVLAAGLILMQATVQATQDQRRQEAALLRTLGASRWQLLAGQAAEFLVLGLLAGVLGAALATALGYVLAIQVFELPYRFNAGVWLWGVAGGGALVTLGGLLGVRPILRQSPLAILRT